MVVVYTTKKAQEKVLTIEVEKAFNDVVATCTTIITGLNQSTQTETTQVAIIENEVRSEEVGEVVLPEEVRRLQERFNNL